MINQLQEKEKTIRKAIKAVPGEGGGTGKSDKLSSFLIANFEMGKNQIHEKYFLLYQQLNYPRSDGFPKTFVLTENK